MSIAINRNSRLYKIWDAVYGRYGSEPENLCEYVGCLVITPVVGLFLTLLLGLGLAAAGLVLFGHPIEFAHSSDFGNFTMVVGGTMDTVFISILLGLHLSSIASRLIRKATRKVGFLQAAYASLKSVGSFFLQPLLGVFLASIIGLGLTAAGVLLFGNAKEFAHRSLLNDFVVGVGGPMDILFLLVLFTVFFPMAAKKLGACQSVHIVTKL